MKKNLILVAGAAGVVIIAVVAYLFLFQVSPQSALVKAVDFFKNGNYYQYEEESSVTMSAAGMTFSTDSKSQVKVDVKNDSRYTRETTEGEDGSSVTETYIIGDKTYVKEDGKVTESKTEKEIELFDDIVSNLAKNGDYNVLTSEVINGKDCFHYKSVLTQNYLNIISDNTATSFEDDSTYSYSKPKVKDAVIETWVSKSDQRVQKSIITIGEISVTMTIKGSNQTAEIKLEDMTMKALFSKYGEKVTIEKPS